MGTTAQPSTESPRVIVIGSGFAGLCMGTRLKRAGIHSFTILEKASTVGGTWRDNHYPGAACDVQSHLYSFSFKQNPKWTRMFAGQAEIQEYLERCADDFGLRPHLRFGCEVVRANFDDAMGVWKVELASGECLEADMVVSAAGFLSRPAKPEIPGLEKFAGTVFHSAEWNHDYDLRGKSVGVIGTGASAIQFVPEVAKTVERLHLFQRTPPWILPKPDRAIGGFERLLYGIVPLLQWAYRVLIYWLLELRVLGLVIHPKLMALPQGLAVKYLERTVKDPALREKLTPKYTMGCKRVLMSNNYFQAIQQPNVELVDTAIREIAPDGIVTRDGELRKLDALILGTGFQVADVVTPFPICGPNKVDLNAHWRDGAEAYLGTTVAGFPNWFFIVGPNTGLGHSSMVIMIEAQVDHVMKCIHAMKKSRASRIEVRRDAERSYNDRIQAQLQGAVWASGCVSWYRNKAGKNTTLWPSFTFMFRRATNRFVSAHYRIGGDPVGRLPVHEPTPATAEHAA